MAVIAYILQAHDASASIDQSPALSEGATRERLEAYARTVYGPKAFFIRQLTSRFFVAGPADEVCRSSACYYRLLDLRGEALQESIAFSGTGTIWLILSPTEVYLDHFQDEYSRIAFETPGKNYLGVALPRSGASLLVEPVSPEIAKSLQGCSSSR